jgi:predicted nucleic acid-binding protein
LIEAMQGRIRGFNVSVANVWADLQHQLDEAGQRMPIEDSDIATTAFHGGIHLEFPNAFQKRRTRREKQRSPPSSRSRP